MPILRRDFPEEALAPSLRRQARTYEQLGEHQKALPALEELLQIQIRLKGQDHPETEAVRKEMQQVRKATG